MSLLAHLSALVEDAAARLPRVSRKRMFGCDAFFAGERIFALVWKDGRIGVKLGEPADYEEMSGMTGAEPWSPNGKVVMGKWLLVPESMHDDAEALAEWLARAHRSALAAPPRPGAKKRAPGKIAAPKREKRR